jgi:hypothetical protein
VDKREQPAATVPLAAVIDGIGNHAAVFALENQVARRVAVTVAFLYRDRAALAEFPPGISAVVSEGAQSLIDGAAVRVVP